MNMFKPVKATTIKEYVESLPPDLRDIFDFMDTFIKKNAPSLKPVFAYNMLGYGMFKTRNYKKEMIDWPTISLASQKNYMSLYICSVIDRKYIAESHKDELGNVKVGKSCIQFKKLEDLNLDGLKKSTETS